tara:strand:+ start:3839 stop:4498 length:660 start_codon:yes stop_codon:yes gene_type:complete
MLISYSKIFTVKAIRNLCRIKGIRYISNYNKDYLLVLLKKYNATKIIQSGLRNKTINEKTCPICHESLKYPFISIKVNDKFFYYDFYTFVEYLNKTQDFRDPCTRQIIKDNKLMQINKLIRYYYGKTTNKILISKSMIKNTDLNIITYCLYDILNEVQNKCMTLEEIYNNILPRFIYYINYLIKNHSREDSEIILKACRESMDNRAILDYIQLMEVINY